LATAKADIATAADEQDKAQKEAFAKQKQEHLDAAKAALEKF